jgi:hypothetical protein
MVITYNGICLGFKEITMRLERRQKQPFIFRRRKTYIPSVDHPCRRFNLGIKNKAKEDLVEAIT